MSMNIEQALHMVGGAGDASYSSNSKHQEKLIVLTKPSLENAIKEAMMSKKIPCETMVFVDLGCSSGPNTLSFIAQVLHVIGKQCQMLERKPPEVQFFLNDLPNNDFNCLFQSLEKSKGEREELLVPYYIAGAPGSFYTRLFPCSTVDLFHSFFSLHWLSQVPEGLTNDQGVLLNKRNINILNTSSPEVVKAYKKQYQKDFSRFLKNRYVELNTEGEMVLTFLGRKSVHPVDSELCYFYGLLADALNSMASEGRIAQDKVDTFEVPVYGPSMQEVKSIILAQGLFHIKEKKIFSYSWDSFVDSIGDTALDNLAICGKNIAKSFRAVTEPLISYQFGNAILDELFLRFEENVSHHLIAGQALCTTLLVVLKKKI